MTSHHPSIAIISNAQLADITRKLQQLTWQAAGYERLKAICQQQKGRIAELENRVASADDTTRQYWAMIRNGQEEIRALKREREQALAMGASGETASLRLTADAMERRLEQQEQQLEAADKRIKELEAALLLKSLPAGSLDNVLQLARAA